MDELCCFRIFFADTSVRPAVSNLAILFKYRTNSLIVHTLPPPLFLCYGTRVVEGPPFALPIKKLPLFDCAL
jgi:hypothetical protein